MPTSSARRPGFGCSLREGIAVVDALGFNAIAFQCLDFRPTDDAFQPGDDVRQVLTFCEPAAPYDRVRVNCWKRGSQPVDLVTSGGHEAAFEGRRVFPLPFVLRHYPVRSQHHGERKILHERRPRFRPEERARGWHVQYDGVSVTTGFIRDPQTLARYDAVAQRAEMAVRHLASQQQAIADAREALQRATVDLARETRRARELDEVATAANEEISRLESELGERTRTLQAIERSLSWRWTRPVRALLRVLRGY